MWKSIPAWTYITVLFSLSAASTGQGSDKTPDPAYEAIRKLQPRLSQSQAKALAKDFVVVSHERSCQIPWQILVSIAYNESSLGIHTVNLSSKDYGIMQINRNNILHYGLSQDRLMRDVAYSIRFACKLIKENKTRYSSNRPYWLGVYRSGTALWRDAIVDNAIRYDRIIRNTARKIGFYEESYVASAR